MKAMFYHTPTQFTVNEIRGMTYAQKLADQFEKNSTIRIRYLSCQ